MRPTEATSPCTAPRARHSFRTGAALLAIGLGALLPAGPAAAQDFRLHLEPAVAFWVDEPQSSRFTPGFYFAVRPGIELGPVVALQLSYALLVTPAAEGFTETGTAHFAMAGVRVRPLAHFQPRAEQLGGLFADFNFGYVRTDDLDRFGFDFGLGYGFQLTPGFALGVVLRYAHIVQPNDDPLQDPNDGQLMTIGLDLAFGPAREDEPAAVTQAAPECKPVAAEETACCPDLDRDGVCDANDRCPTQAGPASTQGCPVDPCKGSPITVLVQFPYDSAELPPPRDDAPQTMDPVLDAVAKAIAQDPSCRVCIIGYASEEGPAEHNEDLSHNRANAVQGYMTARGLGQSRMPTTGFGARCQLIPETTLVLNRRVDFRRLNEGESCPAVCPPQ